MSAHPSLSRPTLWCLLLAALLVGSPTLGCDDGASSETDTSTDTATDTLAGDVGGDAEDGAVDTGDASTDTPDVGGDSSADTGASDADAADDDQETVAPTPCAPEASGWTTCAKLGFGDRQETAVVVLGDEIVVIGGVDGAGRTVAVVEAFDASVNRWRRLADLPVIMHHVHAAVTGDVLYVIGFLDSAFGEEGRVFEYDASGDRWIEREPMPRPRGAGVAVVLDGEIVILGGLQGGSAVATADAWDPGADTWRQLPDMLEPRDHLAAGVIDGKIVVAGGRRASLSSNTAAVDIYDPAANTWTAGAPMPTARGGVASAVLGGELFVIGGEGNPDSPVGVFEEVEAYEPSTDSWRSVTPLPIPIHGTGAATLDGRIHVPGGADEDFFAAIDTHQVYVP